MADAKIRVKLGHIEVEYEGDASFLKKDLLATVKELLELQKLNPLIAAQTAKAHTVSPSRTPTESTGQFDHTTDTIATILKADTGPELVIAATGHLAIVKGEPSSTRKQIFNEMRKATSHYKSSYQNNLSAYLTGLTSKGRLRLVGKDTYAMSKTAKAELEAKLALN